MARFQSMQMISSCCAMGVVFYIVFNEHDGRALNCNQCI